MRKLIIPLMSLLMCCFMAGALFGIHENTSHTLSPIEPVQWSMPRQIVDYAVSGTKHANNAIDPDSDYSKSDNAFKWWDELPDTMSIIKI